MQKQIATFPIPNLHIVGFQKCGTSAMAHFLSQHPDICMVAGKEAHVFDDPKYALAVDKTAMAIDKYKEKLPHYEGQSYIMDCTPITLFHPAFISACVALNPDAKFIVMRRDPVKRAFSHYQMTRQRGLEPYSPFKAFILEPWRMRGWMKRLPSCPFEHPYRDHSYLYRGRYQRQLHLLYKIVEARQVLLIDQEQLANAHAQTLQQVFDFLELTAINIKQEDVFSSPSNKNASLGATLFAKLYFSIFS